jgi:hypothetical protein
VNVISIHQLSYPPSLIKRSASEPYGISSSVAAEPEAAEEVLQEEPAQEVQAEEDVVDEL